MGPFTILRAYLRKVFPILSLRERVYSAAGSTDFSGYVAMWRRRECGTPSRNRANGMDAMPGRHRGDAGAGKGHWGWGSNRGSPEMLDADAVDAMKTQIRIWIRAPKRRAASCWPCARRAVVGIIFGDPSALSFASHPSYLRTG